ncbi:MAG: murein biosynthesis integral membrane protein MurJ [Acidimicrobiales bacterium]
MYANIDSRASGDSGDPGDSGESVSRATLSMAIGTALSRLTGLLRIFALAYALGFGALADSYNLSNTLPNIIHDLVLGGVLTATFVPVFVEHLENKPDSADDDISAIVSVSLVVLLVATVLFLVFAPYLVDFIDLYAGAAVRLHEVSLSIELLRLFVPQVACYGLFALATSLLNARRKFTLPAFAPIVNNVVTIIVLIAFGLLARHPNSTWLAGHKDMLLLLGLGTTSGILLQFLILLPSLRRLDLRLHWNLSFSHPAVRKILRLGAWTIGFVVANQISLLVVLAIAQHLEVGALSAYTYAYSFFQVPFGIITVSVMGTSVPAMASSWFARSRSAFSRTFSVGLTRILAVVLPAMAVEVVMARPLIALLLGHGTGNFASTALTGQALAMLALGLPGFSVFMYCMATLQSVQRMRTVFVFYLIQNAVNVALALTLPKLLGLRGLMLSISVAYDIIAVFALLYVRRQLMPGMPRLALRVVIRIVVATCFLAVALAAGLSISTSDSMQWLLIRVITALGGGGVVYLLVAILLGSIDRHFRQPNRHPHT